MSAVLFAIGLARSVPGPDMAARGRAFARALLSPIPAKTMPYVASDMKYKVAPPPPIRRPRPAVEETLAGFRKVFRGCKLGKVRLSDPSSNPPGIEPFVDVELVCPHDAAHANGELFLALYFSNGVFVRADLQMGLPVTFNSN